MPHERDDRARVPPRWFVRTAWSVHRAVYRLTAGRLGLWRAKPSRWGTLRLTTVGRRSGRQRSVSLGYFDDGSTDVLRPWLVNRGVAGDPHPAWAADPAKAMAGDAGGFRVGDLVTIEGQRFSRYARRLTAAAPRSVHA